MVSPSTRRQVDWTSPSLTLFLSCRLRDQMNIIEKSSDIDRLVSTVKDTGGVYFVTAFSGLLAPYWDSEAGGLLIGISAYTTRAHICRATLEAASFQVRPQLSSPLLPFLPLSARKLTSHPPFRPPRLCLPCRPVRSWKRCVPTRRRSSRSSGSTEG